MESTIRKWTSELANDVNAVSPDSRVSKRYLFSKLQASTDYYIRQIPLLELIRGNLHYTTVPCFHMETKSTIECCSFNIPNCKTVQVSINEIPETFGIISVYNLDDDAYRVVTARKFKNIINDTEYYNPNDKYAYIENKRLIIPNSDVDIVKLGGYFINPLKVKQLGCGGNEIDNCYSPLDEYFPIPDKIKNIVMKDALQNILTKLQISKDENTNSNSNIK